MKNCIINPNTQNLIKEAILAESFVEAIVLCEGFIAEKLKDLLRMETHSERYGNKDIISTCRAINRYSFDKRISPFVNDKLMIWWENRNKLFHNQDELLYTPKERLKELKKIAIKGQILVEQIFLILSTYEKPKARTITLN